MLEKHTAIYVRVSSGGQDHKSQTPDLQRWADSQAGPVKWFIDKFTGTTMDRPAWNKIEEGIRAGKISQVVVWRLDRLGRTVSGLSTLFDLLRDRRVNLVSLKDSLDLSTAAGRLMANVLASVAAYETEIRGERVQAGIAAAKAAGKKWGGSKPGVRKKVSDVQEKMIRRMKQDGEPITAIAAAVGLSRPTIYNVLESTPAELPEKKIVTLRKLMAAEDWRGALKLAASFPRLGDQKAAIERGWNAFTSPDTYRQMGKDPKKLIADGVEALRERYP